jgi:hypothetical protein
MPFVVRSIGLAIYLVSGYTVTIYNRIDQST